MGEYVAVLVGGAAAFDVQGNDSQQCAVAAAILDQGILHDAYQRATIGRNRQTFHPLVVNSARGVGGIEFLLAYGVRRGHKEGLRQLKCPSAPTGGTVKFVDI